MSNSQVGGEESNEADMLRDFLIVAGDEPPVPPARRVGGRRAGLSEARMVLQARKDAVDLRLVGAMTHELRDTVLKDEHDTNKEALMNACAAYGVAQALLDGIGPTEESLAVRAFNGAWDFLSPFPVELLEPIVLGRGDSALQLGAQHIQIRCPPEWRWPAWGFYTKANTLTTVYDQRREVSRDVMIFYGFRNLGSAPLHLSHLEFARGDIRVIQVEDISALAAGPGSEYLMRTPVMYKRGDAFRINVHTTADAIHNHDRIMPLGFVVEPLGLHISGE